MIERLTKIHQGFSGAQTANVESQIKWVMDWLMLCITDDSSKHRLNMFHKFLLARQGPIQNRLNRYSQNAERPGVKLRTIHGSKGHEYKNVWVMSTDDDQDDYILRFVSDSVIRLYFVAFTRAQDRLVISWKGLHHRLIDDLFHRSHRDLLSFIPPRNVF